MCFWHPISRHIPGSLAIVVFVGRTYIKIRARVDLTGDPQPLRATGVKNERTTFEAKSIQIAPGNISPGTHVNTNKG